MSVIAPANLRGASEMNDMLLGVDWLSTVKPDDDDYVRAHIECLKTLGPDEWHRAALDFNWTNRLEPLLWIVMQDDCDLATALNVFWRCEPGWDLMLLARGEDADERDEAAIIKHIADRIQAGTYHRREIAFAIESGMIADYQEMERDCAAIANPQYRPHPDMIRPLIGREVTNDAAFYQRYPQPFHGSVMIDWPDDEDGEALGEGDPDEYQAVRPIRSQRAAHTDEAAPSARDIAVDALEGALLNVGIFGLAAGLVPLVEFKETRLLAGGALLVIGLAFAARKIVRSSSQVAAVMRANGNSISPVAVGAIGLAAFISGFVLLRAALKGYWLLLERGLFSDPAGYGKAVAMTIGFALLWVLAHVASRILTDRVIVR